MKLIISLIFVFCYLLVKHPFVEAKKSGCITLINKYSLGNFVLCSEEAYNKVKR